MSPDIIPTANAQPGDKEFEKKSCTEETLIICLHVFVVLGILSWIISYLNAIIRLLIVLLQTYLSTLISPRQNSNKF